MYRFYDKKVVICHPLCHNIEIWKLWLYLLISSFIPESICLRKINSSTSSYEYFPN